MVWSEEGHPRVCGGTGARASGDARRIGASTCVRRNRICAPCTFPALRGIHVCAEEPTVGALAMANLQGHPRVCGGTEQVAAAEAFLSGASTCVRRNRWRNASSNGGIGGIHVCAEEPTAAVVSGLSPMGHPRVCGGTAMCKGGRKSKARGIHVCAEEPNRPHRRCSDSEGHPRVCGGTEGCVKARTA
jgi:hypothetical protein